MLHHLLDQMHVYRRKNKGQPQTCDVTYMNRELPHPLQFVTDTDPL